MALSYYRWFVPAWGLPMVSKLILRNTLLTQLTVNQGKPLDQYKLTANHGGL
jgi:hypothetical protein